jgi:sugar phosphate isomerase/epimerase
MVHTTDILAVSPCSNPELGLDQALDAYGRIGYRSFEAFTSWVKSALDIDADPAAYRQLAAERGMRFTSLHLPPVTDDLDATLRQAVQGARFADALGVEVVLFKAASRELYIRAARPFLDAIGGLSVIPVLQNHAGSPITTLREFHEVIEGIGDARMKTLLETGHFHTAGVSWREGHGLLGSSVALVHVKDQVGPQSVPFGTGEMDLPGLFRHMAASGYQGRYVVEMEVRDTENTLRYLAEALEYLTANCLEC